MEKKQIIPGLEVAKNEDGTKVFKLHYSADPNKDPQTEKGKAWCEEAYKLFAGGRSGTKWRREMEIDWSAGSGELVFPYFVARESDIVINASAFTEDFVSKCNLYGGLDWGKRNPVSFHVYAEDEQGKFYVIWEWYEAGRDPIAVAEAIKSCPYYSRLQWIAADPSMWNENQANASRDGFTSYARIFMEDMPEALQLDKLIAGHSKKDNIAADLLHIAWRDQDPRLKIGANCPKLIKEIKNLRYVENKYTVNEPEKILDKDNHAFDDLKYFLTSHPSASEFKPKMKYGTWGYYNAVNDLANEIASETGQDPQRVFNDLYGKAFL